MKGVFYKTLIFLSRIFGDWVFVLISRGIAAGYFLFSSRVKDSREFYRALYPGKSRFFHSLCTFRQYQNFTTIYFDRLLTWNVDEISFTSEGLENLMPYLGGNGAILLMSHLGNWELAAHLLAKELNNPEILLYMGVREKEEIERMQKEGLKASGIRIIAADKDGGSPFSFIEGIHLLKEGGIVSLTGDRIWTQKQRTVCVKFLGHDVYLPESPYRFALISEAPLFAFFTFRTGNKAYHFSLSRPITIKAGPRASRDAAIKQAAQQYADLLETALRKHPYQWYHFDRFLAP